MSGLFIDPGLIVMGVYTPSRWGLLTGSVNGENPISIDALDSPFLGVDDVIFLSQN